MKTIVSCSPRDWLENTLRSWRLTYIFNFLLLRILCVLWLHEPPTLSPTVIIHHVLHPRREGRDLWPLTSTVTVCDVSELQPVLWLESRQNHMMVVTVNATFTILNAFLLTSHRPWFDSELKTREKPKNFIYPATFTQSAQHALCTLNKQTDVKVK